MKKHLGLLVLAVLFAVCAAKTEWNQLDSYTFEKYVAEYGKQYNSQEEYNMRKSLFEEKLVSIMKHNSDPSFSWKRGVNHLSDRTTEEFSKLLGYKKQLAYLSKKNNKRANIPFKYDTLGLLDSLPTSVDWREKGVISPVKDQGQCGSCWTFSAAEAVESHWALANGGRLPVLSEQQILDCTPNPKHCGGSGGCSGGTYELAFARIIEMGGLSSEWTYPYVSYFGKDFKCHYNATLTPPAAMLKEYVVLPSNEYEPTMVALATQGPLAISVDASAWHDYESGVFNGCNQTNPDLDHAVQLVGYGTDTRYGDYWIVRNSWGPAWGEAGYIRIMRTPTVECGTDLNPSDGSGCEGGPSQVKVCGTCGILFDNNYPIAK